MQGSENEKKNFKINLAGNQCKGDNRGVMRFLFPVKAELGRAEGGLGRVG